MIGKRQEARGKRQEARGGDRVSRLKKGGDIGIFKTIFLFPKSQGETEVLLGHAYDAGVGADHQHAKVRGVPGHAKHGRF